MLLLLIKKASTYFLFIVFLRGNKAAFFLKILQHIKNSHKYIVNIYFLFHINLAKYSKKIPFHSRSFSIL